jgi:hypothetical protein
MKPKIYPLIERCVENGAVRGYRRSYKHIDDPSEEAICANILFSVMEELSECFDFEFGAGKE